MKNPPYRPPHEAQRAKMEKLLSKPRHVRELVRMTGSSERSVYRWIERLMKCGRTVVRVPGREAIFYLLEKRR